MLFERRVETSRNREFTLTLYNWLAQSYTSLKPKLHRNMIRNQSHTQERIPSQAQAMLPNGLSQELNEAIKDLANRAPS